MTYIKTVSYSFVKTIYSFIIKYCIKHIKERPQSHHIRSINSYNNASIFLFRDKPQCDVRYGQSKASSPHDLMQQNYVISKFQLTIHLSMQQKHFYSVTERPDQSTIAASKAAEHHYKSVDARFLQMRPSNHFAT